MADDREASATRTPAHEAWAVGDLGDGLPSPRRPGAAAGPRAVGSGAVGPLGDRCAQSHGVVPRTGDRAMNPYVTAPVQNDAGLSKSALCAPGWAAPPFRAADTAIKATARLPATPVPIIASRLSGGRRRAGSGAFGDIAGRGGLSPIVTGAAGAGAPDGELPAAVGSTVGIGA